MELLTKELKIRLLENGRKQESVRGTADEIDFWPVVKLFPPVDRIAHSDGKLAQINLSLESI